MQKADSQQQDLQLLQINPKQLLQKYYPLIAKVVQTHLEASAYTVFSRKEMLQTIVKRLIRQLLRLYKYYGKKAYIKTLILEATRMLCHDVEDLYLLENQAKQLTVKYEAMIVQQTYTYVNANKLQEDQARDVIQYVSEQLLSKIQSNKLHFEGTEALFRTYFYRVIDNAIKDGIRKLHSQKALMGSGMELKANHALNENPFAAISGKIDLEKQCEVYRELLRQYKPKDRHKFELNAKVSCYLILTEEDIKWVLIDHERQVQHLVSFGKNYAEMGKEALWTTLVTFFNAIEGKCISANSLYKWFARRRNLVLTKILYVMNFDGQLQKELSEIEKSLLIKLNQRAVGKFAEEYFSEMVYANYR